MLFQRKVDAAMKWLKGKNKDHQAPEEYMDGENDYQYDPKAEWDAENQNKLEKGDIPALILSALLVFGPIILILILLLRWLI